MNGILYKTNLWKNIKFKKGYFFTKTQESRFNLYLNFILKLGAFHWICIKLNKSFEKNWNNKSKGQVLLNLTGQNDVQKWFFIRKFNGIDLCEVIT
jgi:hypothetical protein